MEEEEGKNNQSCLCIGTLRISFSVEIQKENQHISRPRHGDQTSLYMYIKGIIKQLQFTLCVYVCVCVHTHACLHQ